MIKPDRLLLQGQIYNFLRTITIKYEPIALYLNSTLLQNGMEVNDDDPTTWKYYLNLTGQYHYSDTPMYVTSLDTHESILFSPQTLANNLRTRAVYAPGGVYYNQLCERYPEQVDLIKSILFPVTDITKAIMAPDLTLLGYGSGYLEPDEESVFIMQIEDFLTVLIERWYFNFLDDEPYFYLTFWGSLWTYLAMLLMSGRMANIKTPYVHSWDIWNELGANGLDNYSDILDREKSMMLYQNIDYFRANAGKQSNLIILANRLLGSFGIGLYGRMVVQEAATGAADYQLTPQLVPIRLPATTEALPAEITIKTVGVIQSEIFQKGLTSSESAETILSVERKLGDTTLNEFVTKFLEIRPIAQNKVYADLLNIFLMETLVTSITQGYYSKPVEVFDPLTNDPIYLPPSELLALYNYASLQSMGIEVDTFPTTAHLYSAFNPVIGTPLQTIHYFNEKLYLSQEVKVDEFLSGLSYDQFIDSPTDFSTNATALFLRYLNHLLMDQNTLLDKRHYAYAYLSSLCHTRRVETISLVKGYDTYTDWLGAAGIDITSTILAQYHIQADPKAQWGNLADAIITALIPLNPTLKLLGNFTLSDSGYNRLRQLFIQLCSYRVVFLESDRDTATFVLGAKWSTNYGPDTTDTFADVITTTENLTTDMTKITSSLRLNEGVKLQRETTVDSHVTYTVKMKMEELVNTTTQKAQLAGSQINTQSTAMVQGPLTLPYARTKTQMVPFP